MLENDDCEAVPRHSTLDFIRRFARAYSAIPVTSPELQGMILN